MSRFDGDCDDSYQAYSLWRRAVQNAIQGRRGQAVLRELEVALVALPAPRLIEGALCREGEVCALGALVRQRGVEIPAAYRVDCDADEGNYGAGEVALWARESLGLTLALASEIQWQNDEGVWRTETPEQRYERVLAWTRSKIMETA